MGVEGSGGGSHYPDDGTDLSFLSSLPPLGDLRHAEGGRKQVAQESFPYEQKRRQVKKKIKPPERTSNFELR